MLDTSSDRFPNTTYSGGKQNTGKEYSDRISRTSLYVSRTLRRSQNDNIHTDSRQARTSTRCSRAKNDAECTINVETHIYTIQRIFFVWTSIRVLRGLRYCKQAACLVVAISLVRGDGLVVIDLRKGAVNGKYA